MDGWEVGRDDGRRKKNLRVVHRGDMMSQLRYPQMSIITPLGRGGVIPIIGIILRVIMPNWCAPEVSKS